MALSRIMKARGCSPSSLETRAKGALLGMRGRGGARSPGMKVKQWSEGVNGTPHGEEALLRRLEP
jgi:hypothetical protein